MAAAVPGAGWAKDLLLREEQDATAAREGDVTSRLQQLQLLRGRQSVAAQAADQTMAHYNRILHEYIVRAYDRADRGELWRKGASAADRLRALQGAIKDELLRAGLRRSLVATWSLYNSNLFNAAALRRDAGRDAADTPVLVTLNCAPVDDGGSNISASSWTPDYVTTIVDALAAHGLWPRDLTPLVVELRAVCPALVAASDAGLARVDCTCAGAGWACGDYPECATAALERRTHARCLRTTHAAATACWVRLDHARVPALAARRNYDEAPTHAYTGGGGLRAEAAARASPYVSDGCVRVGGFHPGHDAYCQGRYLADNIASWALAGLLVQVHGRHRPDVAVACADACRREGAVRAFARSLVPTVVSALCRRGHAKRLRLGPHAELVNALAPMYAAPPLVDALLAAAAPMHAADGWGAGFEQDPGFSIAPPGTLAAVAAARGVVVVRGLDVSPEDLSALVNHGVGPARPPPKPAGWPSLKNGPETIHLLGSPGSGGEFVRACADDSAGDDAALEKWLAGGEPCEVTDWHVDEPWESAPARFTVLWAAESEGPIETRFASTRMDRIDAADRALLTGAVGTFAPPPWLPQEKGTARHALTRDDAMYICADSLRDVDGMARRDAVALCFRLTRACAARAASHLWRPRDLVVIDNHQTLHKRVPYDHASQRRLLYRLRADAYVV